LFFIDNLGHQSEHFEHFNHNFFFLFFKKKKKRKKKHSERKRPLHRDIFMRSILFYFWGESHILEENIFPLKGWDIGRRERKTKKKEIYGFLEDLEEINI
jgi:hypothetical protein